MRLLNWQSPKWIHVFLLVAPSFLVIRLIHTTGYEHTALLYLGVPYLVAVALLYLTPDPKGDGAFRWFMRHLRNSLIIFLGTSALLMEGFVCVLMFMPIYYAVLILVWLSYRLDERRIREHGASRKLHSGALAIVLVLASLEGVTGALSFNREESITRSVIVQQTPEELRRNMAQPIDFTEDRHWFLRIFPLPSGVEAGSLEAGDLHTVHFTYHRWFVTNTHVGEMKLRLKEVHDDRMVTKVESNTGYLAGYMKLHGTEVRFEPAGDSATRVSLTVHYRRLLDPVWYFGPLQRFAAGESAEYLIRTVIARDSRG